MMEAVTWSFISKAEARAFGGGDAMLALANPIAAELSDMRPSLLPGLLKGAQRNADRGFGDVALFEVGQCFASDEPEGQTIRAAGIRRGTARMEGVGRHWDGAPAPSTSSTPRPTRWRCSARSASPSGGLQVVPGGPDYLHPGRSGTLQFGPKNVVGHFGELHPAALKALDVKGPVVAFEITLDALPAPKAKPTKMKPKLALSTSSRSPAISPSWSKRASPPATSSRPRRGPTAADHRRAGLRRLRGRACRRGAQVGRRRRDAAADAEDADRREIEAVSQKIVAEVVEEDRRDPARLRVCQASTGLAENLAPKARDEPIDRTRRPAYHAPSRPQRCCESGRGCSSVGRALQSHCRGQGFESPQLHQSGLS
jgi:ribosomal protein L13E